MGAIRLFLAAGVAFAHLAAMVMQPAGIPFDPGWMFNFAGARPVLFFYIVSGFLISFVIETKYGTTRDGALGFYRARFLRIYPLWWAALAAGIALTGALSFGHTVLAASLIGGDWLVAFRAYPDLWWFGFPSPLGIAWTLSAELTFYALAPFLLRSNKRVAAVFAVLLVVRAIVLYAVPIGAPAHFSWGYFFLPATFGFFLLGHLARIAARYLSIGLGVSLWLLAGAAMLSWAEPSPSIEGPLAHLAAIAFALALPAIFAATRNSRLFNTLGDMSYPLYLTHTLVITWLLGHFGSAALVKWPSIIAGAYSTQLLVIAMLALFIVIAAVVHVVVEIPARMIVGRAMTAGAVLLRQEQPMQPHADKAPDDVDLRMVRAGCDALTKIDPSFAADFRAGDIVQSVYDAMSAKRRQPD